MAVPNRPVWLPGHAAQLAVTLLADQVGLRLSGEADLSTVDLLRWAIAALPPDADEIHLQLASLDFIDVAATRELITLTSRPGRPRLVLHYPPPAMLELLAVCWPETRPRFVIGATRPRRARQGPADLVPPAPGPHHQAAARRHCPVGRFLSLGYGTTR